MPSARQSRSAARGGRRMFAVSHASSRRDQAEAHPGGRPHRRTEPARNGRLPRQAARPRTPLWPALHRAHRHLSSGLSAAQSRREAQGLGGLEVRAELLQEHVHGAELMATAPEHFAPLPEVLVRSMTEADVAAVVAIEFASYRFPWSEGIFRDCLGVGFLCRVAAPADAVTGYGIVSTG